MDISSINSSSGGFYDSLTSPFTVKRVTMNAYTPLEPPEPAQGTFSRNSFYQNKTRAYSKLKTGSLGTGIQSPNKIIENSISAGISPMDAVQIYKAQRAYGLSSIETTSGVSRMRTGYYTV